MVRGWLRKRLYPSAIGLLITSLVLALQFTDATVPRQLVQRLDSLIYDLRLKLTLRAQPQDPRIVIVDIDEHSLKEEGHWPWPRDKLAQLVEQLLHAGATVVAFDIVFAEEERNAATTVIERLAQHETGHVDVAAALQARLPLFDNNARFAAALKGHDVVLGYIFHGQQGVSTGQLPPPLAIANGAALDGLDLYTAGKYTGNIATLQETVRHGGFFSLDPDPDGVIRRAPLIVRYGDGLYPALALETARLFLLLEEVTLETAPIGDRVMLEGLRLGASLIPTDSKGRVVIPYRGAMGSFPYLSATDALHGRNTEGVAGAIVLISGTAAGLFDLRPTPLQAVFPGVEVHANLIAGILDNRFPMEPAWASGADFALTLTLGIGLALCLPYLAPLPLALVSALVFCGAAGANLWFWTNSGLILSLAPQLLLIALLAVFNMSYGFLTTFRDKRQLQNMFGQYVPRELVEVMSENPERYGFEGESREMTVLFADIRSFTSIAEKLGANELKAMLNRFFTPMTRIIFEHHGTIDKYVGDMVMAFWGAPVADPDHAKHAVTAALAMQTEVTRMQPELVAAGFPPISIGIGINSGVMNVGDMGSEYRRAYTVIGDTVNLASRLEATTRLYQVGVVVGEHVRESCADTLLFRELDLIRVKGKAQAVRIYEPLCTEEEATPQLRQHLIRHAEGMAAFRHRQWDEAEGIFRALQGVFPECGIYPLYLERIARLRAQALPDNWDGVYERQEK